MALDSKFSPSGWYAPANRNRALAVAFVLVVVICITDYFITGPIGLGNLYFLTIIMAAGFLLPWQVVTMCVVCTALRELFNYATKEWAEMLPRLFLSFSGYVGTGLFVREVVTNRQKVLDSLARFQEQVQLRKDAEEQLQILVE